MYVLESNGVCTSACINIWKPRIVLTEYVCHEWQCNFLNGRINVLYLLIFIKIGLGGVRDEINR